MIDIEKVREKWNTAPCSQQAIEKDEALKRKDQLLAEALEQLLECEWEVSLSVIVKIQKELGITEE